MCHCGTNCHKCHTNTKKHKGTTNATQSSWPCALKVASHHSHCAICGCNPVKLALRTQSRLAPLALRHLHPQMQPSQAGPAHSKSPRTTRTAPLADHKCNPVKLALRTQSRLAPLALRHLQTTNAAQSS